ncbi:tetratricopeptide repeat protein, partial [Microcoleus sp. herbarium7]|uniref:tetratricopeptide repeat protein n=1 Tax=Microcoleus sp. herbarium7 TaxID=3055435 RepID=UPI003B19AFFD
MELLEGVNQGWGRGDVAEFLIAKRIKNGDLAAWLRGFGDRLLEGAQGSTASADAVVSLRELACRLELLGRVAGGELGEVAGNVGREILVEFPIFSGEGNEEGEGEDVDGEAKVWFDRGNEQGNLGQFEEAINSYNQAIALKPDFHQAFSNRGQAQSNLGQFEEAINSYNQAIALKPDFHQAFSNRGISKYFLKQFEEAIDSYNQAIALKPDFHETFFNRGLAQGKLEKFEEAIDSFNQAILIKPDKHEAFLDRAVAEVKLERFEEAIASLDNALEFKPDHSEAWNYRGLALGKLGRLEDAIASFDNALEFKPDYHEAWKNRGLILDDLGRLEDAIASFDNALEFKPDYHEAWKNRGGALSKLGRLEDAIASYDKALEFKPDDHEAWYNRGNTLDNLGRLEEAIASYDKALEIKPDYHEAWYNRGIALGNLGRLEEAIASYDKALEFKPDDHEAWIDRGIILCDSLNRYEEAIVSFDKALEIKPDYHEAWYNRHVAVKNAPKHRLLVYEILQAQFPKSPPVTRTLITHNLKQRGYEGQVLTLQAGLEYCLQNTHPEGYGKLHQALGNAHYSRGQLNSPNTYWNKAATSYKEALKTLKKNAFLKLHLEVLQKLIKTLVSLKQTDEANKLRRDATDLLQPLLRDEDYSQLTQQQLTDKLVSFEQLTVNIFIQSGQFPEALATAETDKNVCLSWLLDALPIPDYETEETVTHAQIQQLLNPTTAAIYWHISDAALTTFIIKSDGLLSPETCFSDFPDEFEKWVKEWNQQYTDYQSKQKEGQQNHPWRGGMASKFARLKEILKIDVIEQQLEGITELILIPHRDLHRFPIHALFSRDFVVSYLPSAAVGLSLQHRFAGISRLSPNLDPPKSPLRRGTLNEQIPPLTSETLNTPVPPFLRGARGDR